MNRRYGLSADATLKAAQSLYEAKLISYPRTDSRQVGNDMKAKISGSLDGLRPLKPLEIGKVGDHHAILPTGKAPGTLPPAAQKVFDAIVTRLIAAFYPACVKEVTTVSAESAGVPFRARGVRVVEPGWTALYPRKEDARKDDETQEMPAFHSGERGPHEPFVRRGESAPPKPFTEDSLLGAMETSGTLVDDEQLRKALKERGLGTPATRASIIETLLTRGDIARDKKTLSATDPGRYLIAVIRDRGLKSPELTGEWEARLREIERGQLDPRRFMAEISRDTTEVVRLGDCPRCGKPVIEGKRGFNCSGWREGCPFVLWREHDGHPLVDDQIRGLLQHRTLPSPKASADSGPAILHLTDQGELTEIPVPVGEPRRPAGKPGRRLSGARRNPMTKRRGTSSARLDGDATPTPASGFASIALGPCPLCGSEVVEQEKSYGCRGWRQGCKFAIWKTIAGKRISVRTAQALLRQGRTPALNRFQSKAGKPFEARLRLEAGEVRFDFGT
jgi:DNA topoisomerase-3